MTAPEVQIALANAGTLARERVLLVGFEGQELANALTDAGARVTQFEQNLRIARSNGPDATFGPWLGDGAFDAAAVVLPKERGRLDLQLAMVHPLLADGGQVFIAGHNDAGVRSAGKHLAAAIGPAEVVDYRFHSRLLRAPVDPTVTPAHPTLQSWRSDSVAATADGTLRLVSYPGVFAHRALDDGTRMLIEACDVKSGSVLDMGCGSGAITATLARRGCAVHAVDVDALAILSTEQTLAANDVAATVWASDVYSDVTERYDAIVCNPPFHAGVRTTSGIAERIVAGAPAHLARGGALWLVANRFLDYVTRLKEQFAHVDVVAEDNKFRVLRAR